MLFIANSGFGVDHLDCAGLKKRGIEILNTPGVLTEDPADFAFAILWSFPRWVIEGQRVTGRGLWSGWELAVMLGTSFCEKTRDNRNGPYWPDA